MEKTGVSARFCQPTTPRPGRAASPARQGDQGRSQSSGPFQAVLDPFHLPWPAASRPQGPAALNGPAGRPGFSARLQPSATDRAFQPNSPDRVRRSAAARRHAERGAESCAGSDVETAVTLILSTPCRRRRTMSSCRAVTVTALAAAPCARLSCAPLVRPLAVDVLRRVRGGVCSRVPRNLASAVSSCSRLGRSAEVVTTLPTHHSIRRPSECDVAS